MDQGRLRGALLALTVGFSVTAAAKDFPAVPGEYIVKLKSTATVMSQGSLEQALGAKIARTVSPENGIVLVRRPLVELRSTGLKTFAQNSMIEYAEPNYIYRVSAGSSSLPNDADFAKLWGLKNTGQTIPGDSGTYTGKVGLDIDAERAWQIETGSSDILVAVIDTGVKYDHPDLQANIFVNEAELNGQPGVDDDGNGCVDDVYGCDFANGDGDPMDVYGHGTHVAGTIGALGNNGTGITGVAWNVKILPVRFLGNDGGGTLENAVKSIDYATKMKVHIMNNSWGGGGFSQALLESIQRAEAAGILFLAAAGNSSNDNDSRPEYPASYQVANVISVAAMDPTGMVADFSNYGKNSVHIAAPGVNILSYTMRGNESWSGTSMACPHVAGVAALLLSQDQTQSYATIKSRLLNSARPVAGLRGRVSTGLVNAYYALTNQVAPADPNDPFTWQRTEATASTPHPYAANTTLEFTLSVPGAKRIAVHFSRFETEAAYDKVTFLDSNGNIVGTMSGKLGETFGPVVEGDTVTLRFTSDGSVNSYGFDVSGLAFE